MPHSSPSPASGQVGAVTGRNHRILVVDDNEAIHDDFRKILTFDQEEADLDAEEAAIFGNATHEAARTPFELAFAHQGGEAADMVRAALKAGQRYAMAFMDVRMPPGWDGLETTLKLWEIDPDLQVVICTAYSDKSWEQMTQVLRHPERLLILKKPFDGIEVLQLAHSITEKWMLLQSSRHNLEELERLVSLRTQELTRANAMLKAEVASHNATGTVLNRREKELTDFFENATVGLMQIGPDGTILRVNQAEMALLGCARKDILGHNVAEFHADAEVISGFMRRLLAGETVHNFESRLRCKDGTLKTVLIDSNALWENGRFVHSRCFTRDITERRKLETQLLRMQRIESVGTLAGGVAHDLNNALSPIILGLELLRLQFPKGMHQGLLDTMDASAQRGREIVRQILTFASGVEGDHTAVSIPRLIAEQVDICRTTFYKKIEVRALLADDLWPVMGDSTQLHQVLMNLSVNARDAMPDGGVLIIEASNLTFSPDAPRLHPAQRPGPYVLLTVTDTGTGIPPQVMEQIFDPFFTTKEAGKGTGLGLSSVLGIVQQHGGFVDAHSEVGSGSRFSVYLPAAPALRLQEVPPDEPALPRGQGQLILVVDDELPVRETMRDTLEVHGYAVLTASDGSEALATFITHRHAVALVITDISMPIMDGPATIVALRQLRPDLPIVAMSGILERGRIAAKPYDEALVTFLQKPFTSEKLLTRLQEALAS